MIVLLLTLLLNIAHGQWMTVTPEATLDCDTSNTFGGVIAPGGEAWIVIDVTGAQNDPFKFTIDACNTNFSSMIDVYRYPPSGNFSTMDYVSITSSNGNNEMRCGHYKGSYIDAEDPNYVDNDDYIFRLYDDYSEGGSYSVSVYCEYFPKNTPSPTLFDVTPENPGAPITCGQTMDGMVDSMSTVWYIIDVPNNDLNKTNYTITKGVSFDGCASTGSGLQLEIYKNDGTGDYVSGNTDGRCGNMGGTYLTWDYSWGWNDGGLDDTYLLSVHSYSPSNYSIYFICEVVTTTASPTAAPTDFAGTILGDITACDQEVSGTLSGESVYYRIDFGNAEFSNVTDGSVPLSMYTCNSNPDLYLQFTFIDPINWNEESAMNYWPGCWGDYDSNQNVNYYYNYYNMYGDNQTERYIRIKDDNGNSGNYTVQFVCGSLPEETPVPTPSPTIPDITTTCTIGCGTTVNFMVDGMNNTQLCEISGVPDRVRFTGCGSDYGVQFYIQNWWDVIYSMGCQNCGYYQQSSNYWWNPSFCIGNVSDVPIIDHWSPDNSNETFYLFVNNQDEYGGDVNAQITMECNYPTAEPTMAPTLEDFTFDGDITTCDQYISGDLTAQQPLYYRIDGALLTNLSTFTLTSCSSPNDLMFQYKLFAPNGNIIWGEDNFHECIDNSGYNIQPWTFFNMYDWCDAGDPNWNYPNCNISYLILKIDSSDFSNQYGYDGYNATTDGPVSFTFHCEYFETPTPSPTPNPTFGTISFEAIVTTCNETVFGTLDENSMKYYKLQGDFTDGSQSLMTIDGCQADEDLIYKVNLYRDGTPWYDGYDSYGCQWNYNHPYKEVWLNNYGMNNTNNSIWVELQAYSYNNNGSSNGDYAITFWCGWKPTTYKPTSSPTDPPDLPFVHIFAGCGETAYSGTATSEYVLIKFILPDGTSNSSGDYCKAVGTFDGCGSDNGVQFDVYSWAGPDSDTYCCSNWYGDRCDNQQSTGPYIQFCPDMYQNSVPYYILKVYKDGWTTGESWDYTVDFICGKVDTPSPTSAPTVIDGTGLTCGDMNVYGDTSEEESKRVTYGFTLDSDQYAYFSVCSVTTYNQYIFYDSGFNVITQQEGWEFEGDDACPVLFAGNSSTLLSAGQYYFQISSPYQAGGPYLLDVVCDTDYVFPDPQATPVITDCNYIQNDTESFPEPTGVCLAASEDGILNSWKFECTSNTQITKYEYFGSALCEGTATDTTALDMSGVFSWNCDTGGAACESVVVTMTRSNGYYDPNNDWEYVQVCEYNETADWFRAAIITDKCYMQHNYGWGMGFISQKTTCNYRSATTKEYVGYDCGASNSEYLFNSTYFGNQECYMDMFIDIEECNGSPVTTLPPGKTYSPTKAPLPDGQTYSPTRDPLPDGQTHSPTRAPLPDGQTYSPTENPVTTSPTATPVDVVDDGDAATMINISLNIIISLIAYILY